MARIVEPTAKQERDWAKWVAKRPAVVRAVAERFEPWSLYRMKSTGQRVTIYSFSENGTVTVEITGQYNVILFDRQVFGIDPADLEPCEVPGPEEAVGTLMSSSEMEENIDALRVSVRPDLFVMGEDGKAQRKQ
jgi:hypothetical protein